jgi:predicted small lipoprotein YifL
VIRVHVLAAAAALTLPLAACGKKGPPLAPLRQVPGPVTELAGRRVGQEVRIQFTLPTQNVSAGRIDLDRIDLYAVTVGPGGIVPPTKELLTRRYLVKTLPVKPLPAEEETPAEPGEPEKPEKPKAPDVKDDRPLPGDRVTYVESLTEAELRPAIVAGPAIPEKGKVPAVPTALDPPVLTRYYVVRGRSRGGEPGAQSPRVALPLVTEPAPPSRVEAKVSEKSLTIEWTPPPATIDPVAASVNAQAWAAVNAPLPPPPVAPTRPRPAADPSAPTLDPAALVPITRLPGVQLPPTVVLPVPPRFNVYAVKDGTIEDTPLNPAPLTAPTFAAGEPAWSQERCFVVRTVRAYGLVSVESPATEPTCVTPVDAFPPAAPAGLKAVPVPGAMNLIWDANGEADLAGYLVLRGEAPGETLQALTPAPIRETNYTDATVKPGVRYVYAIVAVDSASPPNMSAQSPRVEEVAR